MFANMMTIYQARAIMAVSCGSQSIDEVATKLGVVKEYAEQVVDQMKEEGIIKFTDDGKLILTDYGIVSTYAIYDAATLLMKEFDVLTSRPFSCWIQPAPSVLSDPTKKP